MLLAMLCSVRQLSMSGWRIVARLVGVVSALPRQTFCLEARDSSSGPRDLSGSSAPPTVFPNLKLEAISKLEAIAGRMPSSGGGARGGPCLTTGSCFA
jgi:hypothetical protein